VLHRKNGVSRVEADLGGAVVDEGREGLEDAVPVVARAGVQKEVGLGEESEAQFQDELLETAGKLGFDEGRFRV
jgi:hypothetical protein